MVQHALPTVSEGSLVSVFLDTAVNDVKIVRGDEIEQMHGDCFDVRR